MGNQIETEKDDELLTNKECSYTEWRRWIKHNIHNSEADLYNLMKTLFEKMENVEKPKIFRNTFQKSTKFTTKILKDTHDIAALAYFYQKTYKYFSEATLEEFSSFQDVFKNAIYNFEKETLEKTFFYRDYIFENLEKSNDKNLKFMSEKVRIVLSNLGQINFEDLLKRNNPTPKVYFFIVFLFFLCSYILYILGLVHNNLLIF